MGWLPLAAGHALEHLPATVGILGYQQTVHLATIDPRESNDVDKSAGFVLRRQKTLFSPMALLSELFGHLGSSGTVASSTSQSNVSRITDEWRNRGRQQIRTVSPQTNPDRILTAAEISFGAGATKYSPDQDLFPLIERRPEALTIADYIQGTEGNDQVTGTPDNDRVRGFAGNDVVNGGPGDDLLLGNQGRDQLLGRSGDDSLYGGQDADILLGNEDADRLYGNRGDDTLYGGKGDDRLHGGKGDDLLYGNLGSDCFHLSVGVDRVMDFNVAEGDWIAIAFDTRFSFSQQGADLRIDSDLGTLLLSNITLDQFNASQSIVFE